MAKFISPKRVKIPQIWEISPNLVTLRVDRERQTARFPRYRSLPYRRVVSVSMSAGKLENRES